MNELYELPDIRSLVPHRRRMLLLDRLTEIGRNSCSGNATVGENWIARPDGVIDPLLLIELVAQAAAALVGYSRQNERSNSADLLVGIKHAEIFIDRLQPEDSLKVYVKQTIAREDYGVFVGKVTLGTKICVETEIQAFSSQK